MVKKNLETDKIFEKLATEVEKEASKLKVIGVEPVAPFSNPATHHLQQECVRLEKSIADAKIVIGAYRTAIQQMDAE